MSTADFITDDLSNMEKARRAIALAIGFLAMDKGQTNASGARVAHISLEQALKALAERPGPPSKITAILRRDEDGDVSLLASRDGGPEVRVGLLKEARTYEVEVEDPYYGITDIAGRLTSIINKSRETSTFWWGLVDGSYIVNEFACEFDD